MATAAIRMAQPEDARGIAEVHVASWAAAYQDLLPKEKLAELDIDKREDGWRDRLVKAASEWRAWVAIIDNEIVGFAVTQPSVDDDLGPEVHEVAALYLLPSVWRAGLGTALLATAENALRAGGIQNASLWVLEGNDGAVRFYESRGWSFDKRSPSFKDFGAAAHRYRKSI